MNIVIFQTQVLLLVHFTTNIRVVYGRIDEEDQEYLKTIILIVNIGVKKENGKGNKENGIYNLLKKSTSRKSSFISCLKVSNLFCFILVRRLKRIRI